MISPLSQTLLTTALSAAVLCQVQGQGTFQNLNFEQANVPGVPAGQFGSDVSSLDGVPFWTTYIGTNQVSTILHNNLNLGDPAIAILGPSWSLGGILQGQYSVRLQASFPDLSIQPTIAQSGTLPTDAQSIRFYSHTYIISIGVSFDEQPIQLSILGGSSSTYYIWGGDISSFAGQTGELRFYGDASLDNIQFSNQPVPEPSVFGLMAMGTLLVNYWVLRRKR